MSATVMVRVEQGRARDAAERPALPAVGVLLALHRQRPVWVDEKQTVAVCQSVHDVFLQLVGLSQAQAPPSQEAFRNGGKNGCRRHMCVGM